MLVQSKGKFKRVQGTNGRIFLDATGHTITTATLLNRMRRVHGLAKMQFLVDGKEWIADTINGEIYPKDTN